MPSVALVLVSHDGARWLPTVIDGIRAQTVPLARVAAVDTGSKDESAGLLRDAFGAVQQVKGATSFPEAVAHAIDSLREDPPEWVWILHDDANPAPDALERLLAAAQEHPYADFLGPKLREWPSLRALLELGVTISGTGRRETGLERGEYDQGQHDDIRTVLAVNSAGLLARFSAFDALGGFDPQLPMFGNDIDLGWRAAAAGHRTLIVPDAVVFHAEAAHRGVRRTPLTGRHTHYQERRAALWTLLVNGDRLWWRSLRLFLGTLLRVVGFLLVRSVGEALDELAALLNVFSRPGALLRARRGRSHDASVVKPLLAPWWVPYRHGLDFVSDLAQAVTNQAADVAERRRLAAAERDPASFAARRVAVDEEEEYLRDSGLVVRFLTNPVAVTLAVVVALLLVGARSGLGHVSARGLSPAPDSRGAWWGLLLHSWHPLLQGTSVPAPPYVLPLALLGSVVGAPLAVTLVLLLSAPVALWGAWRLLRVAGRLVTPYGAPRWLILWGATTYALVPAVSGAWGDGRLGPVVAGAALPWLAHAALGFAEPEAERRWRAAWRTGLLLSLVAAFTPVAWWVAVLLGVVVVVAAFLLLPSVMGDRSTWGPPALALAVPPVLLAAWWVPMLIHGGVAGLFLDAGRLPSPALDGADLALGRFPHLGAPWWLGLLLPLLAVLALVPARTRIPVLVCWVCGTATAVVALVLSLFTFHTGSVGSPVGLALPMVVVQGAAVVAVVLGAIGARVPDRARLGIGALAGAVTVAGLGWFVVSGNESLTTHSDQVVPAYMLQAAAGGDAHGILVLHGSVRQGVTYTVVRGDGTTVGEDEVVASTPVDRAFSDTVRSFISHPSSASVAALAGSGIQYVVQPAPADPTVSAAIDSTGGLSQASAQNRATRAWQLDQAPSDATLHGHTGWSGWLRMLLLLVELAGVVVVAVLCAPTIERRRRA